MSIGIAYLLKLHVCKRRTKLWFSTWGGPPRLTPRTRDETKLARLYTGAKRYGYRGAQQSIPSFIKGLTTEELYEDISHVTSQIVQFAKDNRELNKEAELEQ